MLAALFGTLLAGASGCSRKAAVKAQIAELERAFPGAEATPTEATRLVKAAVVAARAEDYVTSVEALEEVPTYPA